MVLPTRILLTKQRLPGEFYNCKWHNIVQSIDTRTVAPSVTAPTSNSQYTARSIKYTRRTGHGSLTTDRPLTREAPVKLRTIRRCSYVNFRCRLGNQVLENNNGQCTQQLRHPFYRSVPRLVCPVRFLNHPSKASFKKYIRVQIVSHILPQMLL